jgi:hypothetical protein
VGTDASAMADLQASAEWTRARCRWLEASANKFYFEQDVEVLKTAGDLGFAEVEQLADKRGRITWRVTPTEAGRVESARCGPRGFHAAAFGVPVSVRRLISAKNRPEPNQFTPGQAMFDVEFEWVLTVAGERLKYLLTGQWAISQGLAKTRVSMLYGIKSDTKGRNGWTVQAIYDPDPPR